MEVLGAHQHDHGGLNQAGAAYVFRRDPGTGAWSQAAELTPWTPAAGNFFGHGVGVSNGFAVVGATQQNARGLVDAGAAYVFSIAPECCDLADDDGDALTDADDPDCTGADLEQDPYEGKNPCTDGVDGDGDGLVDFAGDPGCGTPDDLSEELDCFDGLDNDADGFADAADAALNTPAGAIYAVDPDCAGRPATDSEGCGIGAELAPIVLVLRALRRRRYGRGP